MPNPESFQDNTLSGETNNRPTTDKYVVAAVRWEYDNNPNFAEMGFERLAQEDPELARHLLAFARQLEAAIINGEVTLLGGIKAMGIFVESTGKRQQDLSLSDYSVPDDLSSLERSD